MDNKGKTQPTAGVKQYNAVHKDIIHGENIKKEMKYSGKNVMENFQLNPNNVYLMPEKPNYIDPVKRRSELLNKKIVGGFTDDPVEEAFSNERLATALKSKELVPKEKYQIPLTANQEIGWFSNHNARPSSAKDHRLKTNSITKFASDYYGLKKVNPFTIR